MTHAKCKKVVGLKQQRAAALKPKTMTCSHCQSVIDDIEEMRSAVVKQIPGINFIFVGACGQCHHEEWLFIGSPAAVATAKTVFTPLLSALNAPS